MVSAEANTTDTNGYSFTLDIPLRRNLLQPLDD